MNSKQILLILSLTLAIFLIPKPTHAAITTFQIFSPINGEQTLNTTLPLKLFLISTNATYITCNLSLYRWDGTFLYNMTLNITNATVYSDNLSLSPDDYYFYLTCNDTNSSFTSKGPIKIGFGNTIYQWGMILEDPGQYKLGRDIFVPTKLAPTWFGYCNPYVTRDSYYVMAYHGVLVYPLNQTYVKLMSHVWYNGKPYNYTVRPIFPIPYMFDPFYYTNFTYALGQVGAINITKWSYVDDFSFNYLPLSLIPNEYGINDTLWSGLPQILTYPQPTMSFAMPTTFGTTIMAGFIAPPWIIRTNKGIIMKSNEQLDCQGYEIYSNHNFYTGEYGFFNSSVGIDIEGNNVSIQNCIFKNIYHAIIDYNDTKTYTVNYTINIPQLSKKFPFLPLKMTLPYRLVNISLFNIKLYNSSIVNPYGIINATDIYADHSYIFNLNKVNNSVFIDSQIATAAFPFAIYQNSNFTGTEISNKNSYITIAYNGRKLYLFESPMGYLPHYPTIYFLNDTLDNDYFNGISETIMLHQTALSPSCIIYKSNITNTSSEYSLTIVYEDNIMNTTPCAPFASIITNSNITNSCIEYSLINNSKIYNTHMYNPYHVFYSELYNSNIIYETDKLNYEYPSEFSALSVLFSKGLIHPQDYLPFIEQFLSGTPLFAKQVCVKLVNNDSCISAIETHVPILGVTAYLNTMITNTTHTLYAKAISITNNTYIPSDFGEIENNYFYINDSNYLPAISVRASPYVMPYAPTMYYSVLMIGNSALWNKTSVINISSIWNIGADPDEIWNVLASIKSEFVKELANFHIISIEHNKIYVQPASHSNEKYSLSMMYINNNTFHSCTILSSSVADLIVNENITVSGPISRISPFPKMINLMSLNSSTSITTAKATNDMINRLYINPHNPKDYSVNVLIANNQINATNVKYGLCYYMDAGTYTTHNSIYGPDYAVLLNMTYPEFFTYNIFDAKDKDIYIDKNQYDLDIPIYLDPSSFSPAWWSEITPFDPVQMSFKKITITYYTEIGPETITSPIVAILSTPSYQINQWNITTYGNYYLLLNGKGYSQICTDNNHDKRCDQKYVILDPPTIVNIDYYPLWWPHQTLYSIGVPGPGPLIQLTNTSTHPKANLIVKPTELYFYIPNATECQTKTINIEWLGNTQGQISIGKDIQGEYLIWEPTDTFSQLVQPNTLIKLNIQVCSPTNYNTYPKETNATLFIYGTYQSGTLTKKVIIHLIKSKQPHHKKKKPITMPSPIPTSASWFNKLITYALWIILIFAALLLIKAIAHKHAAHKLAYY